MQMFVCVRKSSLCCGFLSHRNQEKPNRKREKIIHPQCSKCRSPFCWKPLVFLDHRVGQVIGQKRFLAENLAVCGLVIVTSVIWSSTLSRDLVGYLLQMVHNRKISWILVRSPSVEGPYHLLFEPT